MPQAKTLIVTTNPAYAQDGTLLSGARLTYRLDRNDLDTADNALIAAGADQEVVFDALGLLPVGFGLWPNARGNQGSRWIVSLKLLNKVIIAPLSVNIPVATLSPVTPFAPLPLELMTLLSGAKTFPQTPPPATPPVVCH